MPTTTKDVSSNPADGEVYSIQHYAIYFVSDMWQFYGCPRVPGTPVFSNNKTDLHNITEILLIVALNTITLILNVVSVKTTNLS